MVKEAFGLLPEDLAFDDRVARPSRCIIERLHLSLRGKLDRQIEPALRA
jgi:hypothetical protein